MATIRKLREKMAGHS